MQYPRVGGIGTPHMVPIYNKQMRERFVEASGDCDAAAPTAQQNNSAKQNETSEQVRIRGVSHFQGWNWREYTAQHTAHSTQHTAHSTQHTAQSWTLLFQYECINEVTKT